MIHLIKLLLSFFIFIVLTGCGPKMDTKESGQDSIKETEEDPTIEDPLPLMWINYEGEKYVFNKIIPKEKIDMNQIISTNTLTKLADGAETGIEIFLYKLDGSLFIIDNSGPTDQWANFTK